MAKHAFAVFTLQGFEAFLAIFIIMHEINNENAIKLPNQYLFV